MTLAEIDATLSRLQAAADTIGANLLELERDPNRKLLETATLTGETAARWNDATRALATLWQSFTRFTEFLDRVTNVRGPRPRISADREAELTGLLSGRSIELTREEVPLGERALLGDRQATTRCTPDELLTTMSEQFDQALHVVVAAGTAWDTLVPRLRDARVALADVSQAATGLGEPIDPDLERLQHRLDVLGDAVANDPLAARATDFDALEAEVVGLRTSLGAATQLRDEIRERVARAQSLMDELRSATRAAAEAHREVMVKIVAPQVPSPPAVDRVVAEQLDDAIALSEQGRWRAAQSALAEWTARADDLVRAAHDCAAANRAPIEERNELRGRLDAYYGMAHGIGKLEDPDASERYERARDILYTAPTDLDHAAELVRDFQGALTAEQPQRKDPR